MRDIDGVLRDDARRWHTRLPEPPEFAATLAGVVARPPKQRPWKLLLSIAATVVLVVGAVTLALRLGHTSSHGKQQHGPASIVVNGKRVPYAGVVPWGAPISYASDRSIVYVYADNDNAHLVKSTCGVIGDRALVIRETSTAVSIVVSGYGYPIPAGAACAGVGHAPVPVAVHLRQPLGGRTLTDVSNGKSHRVLDAATVPTLGTVPSGYVPRTLYWNERTGIATRSWGREPVSRCPCYIGLDYGSGRNMARWRDTPSGSPGTVTIGQATAHTWRETVRGIHQITFQWMPKPGYVLQLFMTWDASHPFTTAQALAIARSVH